MADKRPFQTTSPTHGKGLPGARIPSSPSKPLVSRGVPTRLVDPVVAGGAQPQKAIPAADAGVVRAMVSEGQDAESAGSEGTSAPAATSNGVIPGAYRSALVPPDTFHVP
jgi:hypothetical protein